MAMLVMLPALRVTFTSAPVVLMASSSPVSSAEVVFGTSQVPTATPLTNRTATMIGIDVVVPSVAKNSDAPTAIANPRMTHRRVPYRSESRPDTVEKIAMPTAEENTSNPTLLGWNPRISWK